MSMQTQLLSTATSEAVAWIGDTEAKYTPIDSCSDGVRNGAESDTDCGSPTCKTSQSLCLTGQRCKSNSNCDSQFCGDSARCLHPSCTGIIQSGKGAGWYEIPLKNSRKVRMYCDKDGWTTAHPDSNSNSMWRSAGMPTDGYIPVETAGHTFDEPPSTGDYKSVYHASDYKAYSGHGGAAGPAAGIPDFFKYEMSMERNGWYKWTVHANISVSFKIRGASGNICTFNSRTSNTARGGITWGVVNAYEGDTFYFIVGQKGRQGSRRAGGWGGGGRSQAWGGPGGTSGSGGTHVFLVPAGNAAPDIPSGAGDDWRILVAGGAGATSTEDCNYGHSRRDGGHGGGLNGGTPHTHEGTRAQPGTQSSGGARGHSGTDSGVTSGKRFYGGQGSTNDAGGGGG